MFIWRKKIEPNSFPIVYPQNNRLKQKKINFGKKMARVLFLWHLHLHYNVTNLITTQFPYNTVCFYGPKK